jgi:hypothetical protein
MTAAHPDTPLPRTGRRVVRTTAVATNGRSNGRRTPAATTDPAAPVVPAPTVRTMIVCVADDLPSEVFDQRVLAWHLSVDGSIVVRFWAKPTNPIRRRHLIDPRPGKPTACAGGPLRMLDTAALRLAYRMAAALRYQTWTAVTRGTRDARPWVTFLERHLSEPDYPLAQAETDYGNQPRVLAVRAHNTVTSGPARLAEQDLEMFQAGPMAYQNYQQLLAMAADALLTPGGDRLCPVSDRFADRLTYLQQANRYLDTTDEHTRIIAVQLAD